MSSTAPKTQVWIGERVREYFVTRKALGGLISWKETTRTDSLGNQLHIAAQTPLKVFLNGKEMK